MKIGILTIQGVLNYGNILQGYALQQILKNMGHDVYLIESSEIRSSIKCFNFKLKPYLAPFVYLKRAYRKYIKGEKIYIFYENKIQSSFEYATQHLTDFTNKNIKLHLCDSYEDIKEDTFDMIVVGSDQIWNPLLNKDTLNSFLDFAKNWNIKKIAYAASFGKDNMEDYSSDDIKKCSELAKLFDAISVREDSAVKLCREYLGVKAKHLIDPTMLLNKDYYMSIVEQVAKRENILLKYFLIKDQNKTMIEENIASRLLLKSYSAFNADGVDIGAENVEECIVNSPLEWISSFRDAEFVVTDSFHGTVFSIIFNKPFIIVIDDHINTIRFKSLLKIFGLEDRLIHNVSELHETHFGEINWKRVNEVIAKQRELAFEFLRYCNL